MRLYLVKRDGSREEFDREKLRAGIVLACRKRPVPMQCIDSTVMTIERQLHDLGQPEIESRVLGEMVMSQLRELDAVAYVRFASVYEQFESPEEFGQLVRSLARC